MTYKHTRRGFTQNAIICPPCGEQSLAPEGFNPGVAVATKEGQKRKKSLWPLLPRLTAVLPPQGREMLYGFTQINHVILNLIQNLVVQIFKEARFQIKFGMTPLLNNGGFTRSHHPELVSGSSCFIKGFTLIELLVVVLIIGILAAVALPQYQKAVEKSRLATYIPLVRALYTAEEAYYLENGEYTTDLEALPIQITSDCRLQQSTQAGIYSCDKNTIGIYNLSYIQYHNDNIAYLHILTNYGTDIPRKRGEVWCWSKTEMYRNICKSLGPGTEYEGNVWKYQWRLN